MERQIFREEALKRLASPDKLDETIKITSRFGWIGLLAGAVVLLAALIWSIFGSVPVKVRGEGILTRPSGTPSVCSLTAGLVSEIYVGVNDRVVAGQVIARVAQPDLAAQIQKARALLQERLASHEKMETIDTRQMENAQSDLQEKKATLEHKREMLLQDQVALNKQLAANEKLFQDGLVAKETVEQVQSTVRAKAMEIDANNLEIEQLRTNEEDIKRSPAKNRMDRQREVEELRSELTRLQTTMNASSVVVSPYSGRVTEVPVVQGSAVQAGERLVLLEPSETESEPLQCILFLPATQGKKVAPGMVMQITPSTVSASKEGSIIGLVTSLSPFPATQQRMMTLFNNDQLVQELCASGTPLEVRADLIPSVRSFSGYKWTSGKGPEIRVAVGTVCSVSVTVAENPPITLVIPLLRKYILGVDDGLASQQPE